jgi:hypothetical protein
VTEITSENWVDKGTKDDLSSAAVKLVQIIVKASRKYIPGERKSQPEDKNEFECIVKWEPVYGIHDRLEDGEKGKDYPVLLIVSNDFNTCDWTITNSEPLSVISAAGGEKSFEGVVSWNHESSKVGQELTSNVEEDKEEIRGNETENSVRFWDRSLPFEVIDHRILGELRNKR